MRFDDQESGRLHHRQGAAASATAAINALPDAIPIQEFADSLEIPFLETSAKNSTNVEQVTARGLRFAVVWFVSAERRVAANALQAFITMASEIKSRMQSQPSIKPTGAAAQVNLSGSTVKSGGGCC